MIGLKEIQILAINGVLESEYESLYRNIARWYSSKFSTPLHYVLNDIPQEELWMHYFEHHYYEVKDGENGVEKLKEILATLKKDDADLIKEEIDDDEWAKSELEKLKADDLTRSVSGE